VPDVAYDGNPSTGVPIYVTGFEWQQFGGTSMSAPQWAALCALANSLRSQPIGSAPGILYTLATANYAGYYHDITSGSDGAYAAGPGYDLVTGLGSPMANQLVIALAGGFNSQVAAPVFFPPAGSYASSQNVTLVSATPGASIRYTTDGSTPTDTSGALYSAPVPISANTTLTAIAFAGGLTDSPVANGAYTFLPQVATPTFSPVAGSYTSVQSVSIATTTPGASLRYTTDGSTPTEAIGLPYTGPVSIASATTINAVAYETGYIDSVVASGAYLFPPAAAPAFNPMAGTYLTTQSVAISSATGGASIRYTTDGSTPTETSGTLYSVPVSIGVNTTLKALAYEMAFADSPVASGGYVIGTGNGTLTGSSGGGFFAEALPSAQAGSFTVAFDAAPSVSPENAVVGLSKGGATAYGNLSCIARFNPFGDIDAYNGTAYGPSTVPYSAGVSYHFRFVVNVPAHTYSVYVTPAGGSELTVGLNYVFRSTASVSSLDTWNLEVDATPTGCALQAGNLSLVSSGGGLVAAPTFSPSPGTYATAQMVTISSTTGGASIRYTTDGSTPTESHGTLYSGAPISVANSTALNTVAYEAGYTDSPVIGGVYIIGNSPPPQVVAPLFSPAAGTYASAQMVTITPTTFGSITRYTTDGTIPTETSGTIYFGAPVNIGRTTTLNAISYETGYSDSPVSKGIYTILSQAIPPSFTPAGGTYNSAQTVTISSLTNGSTIAYTLDGSTPAESNGNVTNGTSLPNNGSVFIDASAKLRAMAFVSGYADSMVVTAFYTIDTPIPTAPRIRGSNGNRTPTNRTRRPE
ncbi:MAG: chitobiase/beta-hexosaminidase C-terminal domain-containing protein, partial [Opitutaceae bacterium]